MKIEEMTWRQSLETSQEQAQTSVVDFKHPVTDIQTTGKLDKKTVGQLDNKTTWQPDNLTTRKPENQTIIQQDNQATRKI